MDKILIVGHPQSGYAEVEQLLQRCGMAPAKPSRREGLLPADVHHALLQHGTCRRKRRACSSGAGISQAAPAPVWHGVALDLLLGNVDQPLWGWADPNAIELLDFWCRADPSVHFVLVYDRPQTALTRVEAGARARMTPEQFSESLEQWRTYNAALLAFHRRNRTRTSLVHGRQVRTSIQQCLNQLRPRLQSPCNKRLQLPPELQTAARVPAGPVAADTPWIHGDAQSVVAEMLSEALLTDHLDCIELYNRLQRSANLPSTDEPLVDLSVVHAWKEICVQQLRIEQQAAEIADLGDLLARANGEAHEAKAEARTLAAELAASTLKLGKAQSDKQAAEANANRLRAEVEALKRRVDAAPNPEGSAATKLQAAQAELERSQAHERELQQTISRLSADAEAARIKERSLLGESNARAKENALLLQQLHTVQEELERHQLSASRERAETRFGACDRIKQELAYKIGASLIRNSRSARGWLRMPWDLCRVLVQHHRTRSGAPFIPIEAYSDHHEAERVRKHLSYRLGTAVTRNARSPIGWLRMPWAMYAAIRDFHAESNRRQMIPAEA